MRGELEYTIKRKRHRITVTVILSLLIHFGLIFLMNYWGDWAQRRQKEEEPKIIELMMPKDLEQSYKIVDIAPPPEEKVPDKSQFAGMYDSRVDKEVVSRDSIKGDSKTAFDKKEVSKAAKKETPKPEKRTLKDGISEVKIREKSGEVASKGRYGSMSPEEYIPDYQYGDHTYLNVRKFENVSYFVRMKRVFRMTFNPVSALTHELNLRGMNRNVITTVIGFGIDERGELDELFVIKGSGVMEYDQEALRTVRASAPFSKPPENFLAKDKKMRVSCEFGTYF